MDEIAVTHLVLHSSSMLTRDLFNKGIG